MNATTDDQGNHCIFALNGDSARPPVDTGNRALLVPGATCAEIADGLDDLVPQLSAIFVGG